MKYLIKTKLKVYNSITKKKEIFIPINYPFVGMYLCGPTVYGDSHIGHARSAVVFDVIFRYLKYLKYKVKYVRNITDIGHLDNSFLAEDKVLKQSKLKKVDPMELSQYYTNIYHNYMKLLNVQSPNIEPRATGTILDQIDIVKKFIKSGFAYEVNNSVYFNIKKYSINNYYGILSGRIVDDLISGNRKLFKQKEKKSVLDFAL
jgi:cysteinyl-tRNA synthetase